MNQYRYSVLPGLHILSRTQWTLPKVIGLCLVLVIVVFLATRSKEGRSLMDSAMNGSDKRREAGSPIGDPKQRDMNLLPFRHSSSNTRAVRSRTPLPLASRHRRLNPPKRRRLTKQQRQWVLNRFNHRCNRCGTQLNEYNHDADHHNPLWLAYLGADPNRLQTIDQFVALCTPCHRKKTQRESSSPLFREAMRRKRLYFK